MPGRSEGAKSRAARDSVPSAKASASGHYTASAALIKIMERKDAAILRVASSTATCAFGLCVADQRSPPPPQATSPLPILFGVLGAST